MFYANVYQHPNGGQFSGAQLQILHPNRWMLEQAAKEMAIMEPHTKRIGILRITPH